MTTKKANWLFLTIILAHVGVVLLLTFVVDEISIGIIMNFLLSESILMVPTLLFLLAFEWRNRKTEPIAYGAPAGSGGKRPFEAAAFHKVKISTLLMIALSTFLMMPLVAVLNALSMLFADNAMASLQSSMVDTPFSVMLFMIGIFGPFCEEFVFRGVIYRSYGRKVERGNNTCYQNGRNGGIRAILLSAFLFGLMHMNFNQMIYAFAMGIFLALLVEAAGSLWASVFCHMFFNSIEVGLMYVSRRLLGSSYGRAVSETAAELSKQDLLAALSVYLIIAAVTTPIVGCIVVWIAKNEGRQQAFASLFIKKRIRQAPGNVEGMRNMPQPQNVEGMGNMPQPQNAQGMQTEPQTTSGYLLSIPLIVAMVLCFGFMSLEFFL